MKGKRLLILTLVSVCFCLLLSACTLVDPEKREREETTEMKLSISSAEDLLILEEYPNLVKLDLRGSDCYETCPRFSQRSLRRT